MSKQGNFDTFSMITVSIVTYKTNIEELRRCLNSLSSNLVKKIYIVDNSRQSYIEDFCKSYERVVYIGNPNVGYGSGHNIAIRKAQKMNMKYHLVLNSDVYFEEKILSRLIEYMNNNEDVAQVQPNIVYPDGSLQYGCRLLPKPINLISRRFLFHSFTEKLNREFMLYDFDHKEPMNIPYHQGSFMLFRMECFKKVGLFDERFFMYPEDIDITRRMHRFYRTMFWPEVTIVHTHRAASYKSLRMLAVHSWNMMKYFNKWGWFNDKERDEWNEDVLNSINAKNKKK